MRTQLISSQVSSGLRTAGAWLLGMVWLAVVFAGMGVAFSQSSYPVVVGWLLLSVAAAIFVATADRWVRVFPGIVFVATLNSLIAVSTGHLTNNPSARISTPEAIAVSLLLAASTALSLTFPSRKLKLMDRISLLVFGLTIAWGAVDAARALPMLGIGVSCLLFAWMHGRSRQR